MELAQLAGSKYVSLTTRRRDGGGSATPVWIVDLGGGSVGFTTDASSLKVKRIGNDPSVSLQACDIRGKLRPDSEPVAGVAAVVHGDAFERVRTAVKAKYGLQYKVMIGLDKVAGLFRKGGGAADCAVVISPEGPSVA